MAAASGQPGMAVCGGRPSRWKPVALSLLAVAGVSKVPGLPKVADLFSQGGAVQIWEPAALGLEVSALSAAAEARSAIGINGTLLGWRGAGRALGGGGDAEDAHGEGDGGHDKGYEAMYFMIGALIIGTAILHVSTFKAFHGMQTTVTLFVFGMIVAFIFETDTMRNNRGIIGRSYELWGRIDPHLILMTMLPPLLAGDAMSIDTRLADKVSKQCLYLAGPGVAINAFAAAAFMYGYLPYGWSFLHCLTLGSILCATDPVAVVALLKELGASPTLTVQIQGESLLNDGTAIVLYTVTYKMLSGVDMTVGEILHFLVKTAMFAWMLGILMGGIFARWIRAARNIFDHNSSLLQVALTILCCYASFFFAEGVFHISGVLATVAASIALADRMWLDVVSKDTMHTIWHMFEYLGNTFIFLLAGLLTGRSVVASDIKPLDFIHLFVLYAMLMVIRASFIICSIPLLSCLHVDGAKVTFADALVMGWGGLRGAVGLALAIMVKVDRAGGKLTARDGDLVLFFVGGVAFLTLAINATTCPALVKRLGITRLGVDRKELLKMLVGQIEMSAEEICKATERTSARAHIISTVEAVKQHIPEAVVEGNETNDPEQKYSEAIRAAEDDLNEAIVAFQSVERKYRLKVKRLMPPTTLVKEIHKYMLKCPKGCCEAQLTTAINRVFLNIVMSKYEQMIALGDVPRAMGEVLRSTIVAALHTPLNKLADINFLEEALGMNPPIQRRGSMLMFRKSSIHCLDADLGKTQSCAARSETRTHSFVESAAFNLTVCIAILVSAFLEYVVDGHRDHPAWIAHEILFVTLFAFEIIMRAVDEGRTFFKSGWNLFSLSLVFCDIFATCARFSDLRSNIAAARVFRILKTTRSVRLVKVLMQLRNQAAGITGDPDVRRRMKTFEIHMCLLTAHVLAQRDLMHYFGKFSRPEVCRCILDSMTTVYMAMTVCGKELRGLSLWMFEEQNICRRALDQLKEYEESIEQATSAGVFSSKQAKDVIHLLHKHMTAYADRIQLLRVGGAFRPLWTSDGSNFKEVLRLYEAEDDGEEDDKTPWGIARKKISALRHIGHSIPGTAQHVAQKAMSSQASRTLDME